MLRAADGLLRRRRLLARGQFDRRPLVSCEGGCAGVVQGQQTNYYKVGCASDVAVDKECTKDLGIPVSTPYTMTVYPTEFCDPGSELFSTSGDANGQCQKVTDST